MDAPVTEEPVTCRWARALSEHLRQRGHHAAFRIEPPGRDETGGSALPRIPPQRADVDVVNSPAALARAGDLTGAAAVLATAEAAGNAGLDLLARIHAQRGDLEQADLCWARVQATDPEHPGAAAGRATIEAIRARRRLRRPLLRPAWVTAAGVIVVAGVIALCGSFADDPVAGTAPPAGCGSTRVAELEQQLAAQETTAARHEAALNATAELVAQPGVTVRTAPDTVEIRFPGGLYRTGDQLTADGRQRLRRLGTALSRAGGTITVVGWTVALPGGPPAGGSPVAWSRARAAARELATAGNLPVTRFTLASGDQAAPPFPDPASNRTVTLRISPSP
jgi:type VI secretion system protein ImpK